LSISTYGNALSALSLDKKREATPALDPLATLKVEELVNELKKAYTPCLY
jgi:ABC-type phosphate transport system ATPase subunit